MDEEKYIPFKEPENKNATIWRYMDFTKFVWMLENQKLFFCRSDLLGDPFEGSTSKANEPLRFGSPLRFAETTREELNESYRIFSTNLRKTVYINCWHMNEHESAAMWRLYAKSEEAVAVRSTFARLKSEVVSGAGIGMVNYVDFERDVIPETNIFAPYMHKRLSFAHEREVRAVIGGLLSDTSVESQHEEMPPGVGDPENLTNLIESIFIAPTSAKWFATLVESVCKRYSLTLPVSQSSLDAEPFF